MLVYGGFTGTAIAENLQYVKIETMSKAAGINGWNQVLCDNTSAVEPRFGASLCTAPAAWCDDGRGVVLFGGVNAARDCGDVWLFR